MGRHRGEVCNRVKYSYIGYSVMTSYWPCYMFLY